MNQTWKRQYQEFCRDTLFVAGVYGLSNFITNRIYVGESENIGRRIIEHIQVAINGNHHIAMINQDCQVHGIESFGFTLFDQENEDKARTDAEARITQDIINDPNMEPYSGFHITGHAATKITDEQVVEIRKLKDAGHPYTKIAEICNAKWGYNYTHGRYYWAYKNGPSCAGIR
jgi:group I intron endonuclease